MHFDLPFPGVHPRLEVIGQQRDDAVDPLTVLNITINGVLAANFKAGFPQQPRQ